MKKIIFLLVLVFVCTTNLFALEDDVLYKYINFDLCLSMGATKTHDKDNNEKEMVTVGGLYNIALGLQQNRLRYELAYQQREEVSEVLQALVGLVSTLSIKAVMANVYYDYLRTDNFAMYVGGGFGGDYYKLTMKSSTDFYKDDGYSCILGGYTGITFIINRFSIDLGINYYYINEPETNTFAPKISFRYAF